MPNEIILTLIVAVPIFFSCLIPMIGQISAKARNISALLLALVTFILGLLMAPAVFSGQTVSFFYDFPLGFNFILKADAFALFCALASSFVSAVIVFYSFEYIKSYKNQNEYYFIVLLFLGSMMGIIFSSNLIFIYIFWEMTALASWRLIGFFRKEDYVRRANKAFMVTAGGALIMLAGFIMLAQQAGTFDLDGIRSAIAPGTVKNLTVLLILCGIFAKSATFPFHTWLPDAGIAPSPVTALLHAAVLVKIGVYVYARLFNGVVIPSETMRTVIFVIIAVSAFISGGAALVEKDIKRIIAYSTISQLAFIFLGFAAGSRLAFAGSMLFILMHSTAKAGLFLCAGIIEHEIHTKDITAMGGLGKLMPITFIAFLLCMMSIIGIPPLGGFFSKFFVLTGTADAGYIGATIAFVLAATLTLLYMLRVFYKVFLAESSVTYTLHKSGIRSPMNLSIVILAVMSVICGLSFSGLTNIAELASNQIFGMIK